MDAGLVLPAFQSFVLPEWLRSFEEFLVEELGALPARAEFERLAVEQLLAVDLRLAGRCALPLDLGVPGAHGGVLRGPFLLQVEEWTEIGRPRQQGDGLVDVEVEEYDGEQLQGLRAKKEAASEEEAVAAGGKRMLRLACSGDGRQQTVTAFEYRHCAALSAATLKRGCKIVLSNVVVMGGLLALTPASLRVLGGAWRQDDQQQQQHQQQQVKHEQTEDVMDIEDLRAIEAMERAALAQRSRQQQSSSQPPPASAVASSSPGGAAVRKKSRKKFLDDDD